MQKRQRIAIIIIIFAILILGFAILLIIIEGTKAQKNQKIEIYNESDIYILTEYDDKYGISKIDGTNIIEPKFDQISRVGNFVYLKNEKESFIYSLEKGTYQNLDGKETEVTLEYSSTDNTLLPYFVLRYGSDEQSAIYRIYNEDGTKYSSQDYTNLKDIQKLLKAKTEFTSVTFPENLAKDYNLSNQIPYKTIDNKNQYIVTKKDSNTINATKGVIDETGKVILDFKYKNIDVVKNDANALKLTDTDNNDYIFTKDQKLGKIDNGFDIYGINGGGYLQIKGNTVNKIYDSKLTVAADGIYTYPDDFTFAMNKDHKLLLLLKKSDQKYYLYNLTDSKIEIESYNNIFVDYLKTYTGEYRNSAILFKDAKGNLYILDLSNLKTAKVLVPADYVSSPLDYGILYGSK